MPSWIEYVINYFAVMILAKCGLCYNRTLAYAPPPPPISQFEKTILRAEQVPFIQEMKKEDPEEDWEHVTEAREYFRDL